MTFLQDFLTIDNENPFKNLHENREEGNHHYLGVMLDLWLVSHQDVGNLDKDSEGFEAAKTGHRLNYGQGHNYP